MSGANPNAPCVLPFKFKNFTYHQCTTADNAEGDITPWCSTLIDDSGEHIGDAGNWGYCGPDCSLDLSCKWTNVQIALTFYIIKRQEITKANFLPINELKNSEIASKMVRIKKML